MRRVTGSLETGTQRDLFRGFGLPRKLPAAEFEMLEDRLCDSDAVLIF